LLIALWLIVIVAVVLASGVLGAIKGVWRSFAR